MHTRHLINIYLEMATQANKGLGQQSDENKSTYDKVVELLNHASLMVKDSDKLTCLWKVEELIIRKEPTLLDNFLDEMLAFQTSGGVEVKKYVIHFMEVACKVDPELLPRIVAILPPLLADENVAVTKKLTLCLSSVYKTALQWLVKCKVLTEAMEQVWLGVTQMKSSVTKLIDSDNDGVRTHTIKFLESIVITLTKTSQSADVESTLPSEVCVSDIPDDHPLLNVKKLEEEGQQAFNILLAYQSSPHISSVNLMTCMGSLTTIVKQRPVYMKSVVQGFESLHVNLPPTLSKSQVSSVRKNLKMQMLTLLRLPDAIEFQYNITTLLTDLGATQSEVLKSMPRIDETRKRKAEGGPSYGKKSKTDPSTSSILDDDDEDVTPIIIPTTSSKHKPPVTSSAAPPSTDTDTPQPASAIDVTADDILPRLTPPNVTDLVLLSMVMLPDTMPAQFQAIYTPIAAAGTQLQIKHMARLLATQLVAAGLGKGEQQQEKKEQEKKESEADTVADEESSKQTIETVVGGAISSVNRTQSSQPAAPVPTSSAPAVQSARKGIIQFKLSSVTHPVNRVRADMLAQNAMRRILAADKAAMIGNVADVRSKILSSLVSQFGGQLKEEFIAYIFADLRNRSDLAFAWMYQEYANMQGYNVLSAVPDTQSTVGYDTCLTRLLTGLLERPDHKEGLFSRLILEAPVLTPSAVNILKKYCQDENRIYLGMTTIKDLIIKRPNLKSDFLDILLNFTSHEKSEVRNSAIRVTKKLYERNDLRDTIEKYAMHYLKYLLQPSPPSELLSRGKVKVELAGVWSEETIKLCLYLFLGLLPVDHRLIHDLANIYTAAVADIKRTILRVLETPVKGMGMDSPELLLLVENCPRGAETLVTRIIHILTDKAVPSPELVDRVRDLYQKRVSDVRFLIPVLNGLSKKEVVAALPKLIKLNPVVVKEVFNRLLGVHSHQNFTSPVTPAELLIALHGVDPTKVDVKTIIKACNLCFAEKSIYTQEVLAVVMQQLMDMNPLPTLLMRTVIQSLAMYPKLIGFVMNIMQRLIIKQVWKNRKVWEGFVKCCQRTKPQSFLVLLQLPAVQLRDAFTLCPELREPLLSHIQTLTPHQRAHIPKAIMSVLEKDANEQKAVEKARRVEEERLTQQEKLYQQKVDEDRRLQQEILKQKQEQMRSSTDASTLQIKNEPGTPTYDEDSSSSMDAQTVTASNNLTVIQIKQDPLDASNPHSS